MSARPRFGGARRARLGRPSAGGLVVLALLALVPLAVGATACGSAESDQIGAYVGSWQRVVGGAADPRQALVVGRQDGAARVTFHDLQNGSAAGGLATLEDGYLALDLPVGSGLLDAPEVQLSLDGSGQLVVDRVLGDGTTEPVRVYERAPAPGASTEP